MPFPEAANGRASDRKPSIHLIRIPNRDERKRAFRALLGLEEMWVRLPGNILGVSSKQLEALIGEKVLFDWVARSPADAPAAQS
jgi:hypothetical protein